MLRKASPARGRSIFFNGTRANCASCHRVGGQGNAFAPPLDDVGQRAKPEEILESILKPSKKITEGFFVTTITTKKEKRSVALCATKQHAISTVPGGWSIH